jgi:hypothetical protein
VPSELWLSLSNPVIELCQQFEMGKSNLVSSLTKPVLILHSFTLCNLHLPKNYFPLSLKTLLSVFLSAAYLNVWLCTLSRCSKDYLFVC